MTALTFGELSFVLLSALFICLTAKKEQTLSIDKTSQNIPTLNCNIIKFSIAHYKYKIRTLVLPLFSIGLLSDAAFSPTLQRKTDLLTPSTPSPSFLWLM